MIAAPDRRPSVRFARNDFVDTAMSHNRGLFARVATSVVIGGLAAAHMLYPQFIPDAISVGLILLALVPWLAPMIASIEVPGVGKIVLQEVKDLRKDVDALQFLLSGFVTDWEYQHLQKLAAPEPFEYKRGPNKDDRFVAEVIRLRDFGLIAKRIEHSLWDIPLTGDLKDFVKLTERGETYLRLRKKGAS
jgi:hypothetical protein